MIYNFNFCFILFNFLLNFVSNISLQNNNIFDESICEFSKEFNTKFKPQIRKLWTDSQKIINFTVNGTNSGVTFRQLAKFVDRFGPRLTGTRNLENSINYMVELLKRERHDRVYTETVQVPTWKRGREWAQITNPFTKSMNILGLGFSVGTNGSALTADVIVVKDFDELKQRSNEVKGKFVVYNFNFQSYGKQVKYRDYGAPAASKYGALAALIRSVTPLSIDSPHTGMQTYNDSSVLKIPAVSITVEDAELLYRLTSRGKRVRVSLYMEATNGKDTISRNTVSELIGTQYPDQVVLVSGHLDSWDVGQGAMDDGGGAFISWRALSIIKKLGFTPKRTLRSVLWTGDEFGIIGAKPYAERHSRELDKMSVAMQSDTGTFAPLGLSFSGTNPTAQCIVNEILKLLKPINATRLTFINSTGSDIDALIEKGVPGIDLDNANDKYFDFHHTNGDTMTVLNSDELDLCTAVWAVTSYAFASLDHLLPR